VYLEELDHMLPCDKDGKLTLKTDSNRDLSELSLEEQIMHSVDRDFIIDVGARFDVAFGVDDKLSKMKVTLINELEKMGEFDEDVSKRKRIETPSSTGEFKPAVPNETELAMPPPKKRSIAVPGPIAGPVEPVAAPEAPVAVDGLEDAINACKTKKAVADIGGEYGITFEESLDELKMVSMKETLIEALKEDGKIAVASE
jgi:hypothetical protein